jgi:hypothetical protein
MPRYEDMSISEGLDHMIPRHAFDQPRSQSALRRLVAHGHFQCSLIFLTMMSAKFPMGPPKHCTEGLLFGPITRLYRTDVG